MKYVILVFLILVVHISAFCQNYILIDKQFGEIKDTAYVETIQMPVYLISCFSIPKFIIPLSHLNKNFTIGDYLLKYYYNNCKEDSVLFFLNFSDSKVKNKPYLSSATDIPVLQELNIFLNDTALFSITTNRQKIN